MLEDDIILDIIDLEDYFGKSENSLKRIKGRIIGKNGMTRKVIENMTGVNISVYGRTVSIIGGYDDVTEAKRALEMLMHGSMHSTVYKFLEKSRRKKRVDERRSIWK